MGKVSFKKGSTKIYPEIDPSDKGGSGGNVSILTMAQLNTAMNNGTLVSGTLYAAY